MGQAASMRAVVIDGFGPADRLRAADLPVPAPGPAEVLVRVRAAGINAIDWFTRAGEGVGVPAFPAVLGWDVSGEVVSTGAGVTRWRAGDEVFGMLRFPALAGGYAQYVVAPADQLAAKPADVDHVTAAAVPMPAVTAWQTLFEQAKLAAGQRVLIHGAAGGVGHLAVQLAKVAGAEVLGTASARNHAFLTGLGADGLVDYATERVGDAVSGADVVVDTRGGAGSVELLDALRPGGIIVTLKGQDPDLDEAAARRGLRTGYEYVAPDAGALDNVASLLGAGRLRVALQRVLPLDEVAGAHREGESGHVRGRLVLEVPVNN